MNIDRRRLLGLAPVAAIAAWLSRSQGADAGVMRADRHVWGVSHGGRLVIVSNKFLLSPSSNYNAVIEDVGESALALARRHGLALLGGETEIHSMKETNHDEH